MSISNQKERVAALKAETIANLGILNRLNPIPLNRQIFEEDALEKPTQNLFINITHYLVCVIDPQKGSELIWPLYDSKSEKTYRTELMNFIDSYSKTGLIAPVLSSYYVNPNCFKVVKLLFQLSQLAIQRVLCSKLKSPDHVDKYKAVSQNYKSCKTKEFVEYLTKEMTVLNLELVAFKNKISTFERINVALLEIQSNLNKMKKELNSIQSGYLNSLIEEFLKTLKCDDNSKQAISKLKNVNEIADILNLWLAENDQELLKMEQSWNTNVSTFMEDAKHCKMTSEALLRRHMGEADPNTYMLIYNPATDHLNTHYLESQVNNDQLHVLRNIVKDGKLDYPNLIRGFVISLGFVLKSFEVFNDISRFNQLLKDESGNYKKIVEVFCAWTERVVNMQTDLQVTRRDYLDISTAPSEFIKIPPLPDLSDLKSTRAFKTMDSFTPLTGSKHQFNLKQKSAQWSSFIKPKQKTLFTSLPAPTNEDFFRIANSSRVTYDRPRMNMSQNLSIISTKSKYNETIADCNTGFTKEKIQRLLSTKRKSSTKKATFKLQRPLNIKRGDLFNETNENNLFRSHSSPNLLESKPSRRSKIRERKLSIMTEDVLNVSGISVLKSNNCTPDVEVSRNLEVAGLPQITISPVEQSEPKCNHVIKDSSAILNKLNAVLNLEEENKVIEIIDSPVVKVKENTENIQINYSNTPKNDKSPVAKKPSSIEKIINRYKKIRASVMADDYMPRKDFKTIVEEKENYNIINVDIMSANRNFLPDLLSPSCSVMQKESADILDIISDDEEKKVKYKARESLGTVLGVDESIFDQFNLLD